MNVRGVRGAIALATACLANCSPTNGNASSEQATTTSSASLKQPAQTTPTPPIVQAAAPIEMRTEVALEDEGGTFLIPVTINDAISLKFTIDSGASDVTIPSDVASTLVRAGTISEADYIGTKTFVLADGSQVPSPEFRIRSLRVGSLVLHDVVATITGPKGSLLLGQTFLQRLKSWSIDNHRHVLSLIAAAPGPASVVASGEAPFATGVPSDASAALLEANALEVARQYFVAWSDPTDPDGQTVGDFYSSSVDFYGKQVGREALMAGEKLRFARRWPLRTYTIRPQTLQSECNTRICRVEGVVDWAVATSNRSRNASGTASFSLVLDHGRIIRENGRVLSRN